MSSSRDLCPDASAMEDEQGEPNADIDRGGEDQEESLTTAVVKESPTLLMEDPYQQSEADEEENEEEDIRTGETEEEALQRRIEEGKIGKGKTLRRWKDTEEKQRMVESGRHQSKVQRYGQIYEEVKALRKETRHSVQDLRERFKEKGIIQNKDQFIVRLIAQERNEQEGKVAAIKSLQQWRLTDVELHNFINRCHRKGLAGKLDLAMQWTFEQKEAGGEVNFKEGLAFYSSIGILQPRSSAQTQQQWREWREWEDAMKSAVETRKGRGGAEGAAENPETAGPDASCNEDSTVCNSPWSSERGGGGSFGGFNGSLRASSTHGEGDSAGGNGSARFRSASGNAPEGSRDAARMPRRGRTPASHESPEREGKRQWWTWRSYSPPSSIARQKSAESLATEKKAAATFGKYSASTTAGGSGSSSIRSALKSIVAPGADPPDGAGTTAGGKAGESIVRASGGYLPPRHPLAALQLSPPGPGAVTGSAGEPGAGGNADGEDADDDGRGSSAEEGAPSDGVTRGRRALRVRGAARTRAKGPAGGATPKSGTSPLDEGAAVSTRKRSGRRIASSPGTKRKSVDDSRIESRSQSLSGVLSGLADWLMPGMDSRRKRAESGNELIMEVYPRTPPRSKSKSAPATPRGRRAAVLREGGWFYNGDSDYSTEGENGSFEFDSDDDEGFWGDAGTTEPPRKIGGGGGSSILSRLRRLFT